MKKNKNKKVVEKSEGDSKNKINKLENPKTVQEEYFDTWFSRRVLSGKLRPEQGPEIMTFFKNRGLKDIEDPEKYNEMIKKY